MSHAAEPEADTGQPFAVEPDRATWNWLLRQAAAHHGGDLSACVVAILDATRLAEEDPADPWHGLEARIVRRTGFPPHKVPTGLLMDFCESWDVRTGSAAEVIAELRAALASFPPAAPS